MNNQILSTKKVKTDCEFIVSQQLTWEEAKIRFNLSEGNIQAIYLRYIIIEYGFKRAQIICKDLL
jgi:hypothetical protein